MQTAPAGTDGWVQRLNQYNNNITALGNIFLNKLPYLVLWNITDIIKSKWENWEPHTYTLTGRTITRAREFMNHVSGESSDMRLNEFIELAKKTDSLAITKCLTECKSHAEYREMADKDLSKGCMGDLDNKTLDLLSERIAKYPEWRVIGDGLGFDNIMCQKLNSPREMLNAWMNNNPNATVYRLYYEVFSMPSTALFLNAIPLEGVSKVKLSSCVDWNAPITLFEIQRLTECLKECGFTVNWWNVAEGLKVDNKAQIYMSRMVTKNQVINSVKGEVQGKNKFISEINDGIFQHKSPGGITYEQIKYLASVEKLKFENTNTHGDESMKIFETFFGNMDKLGLGKIKVFHLTQSVFPNLKLSSLPTFEDFLMLYWQDKGANLSLRDFCKQIVNLLKETGACENPQVIDAFLNAYNQIKPCRSYKPEFDESLNRSVVERVEKAASPVVKKDVDENNCKICMEREINAVIIPCGHIGYCLECLKTQKTCPSCREPIQQSYKFFKI